MKTKTKVIILQILLAPSFLSIMTIAFMSISAWMNDKPTFLYGSPVLAIMGIVSLVFMSFVMSYGITMFKSATKLDNLEEKEVEYIKAKEKYETKLQELEVDFFNKRATTKLTPRKKGATVKEFIVLDYHELVKESKLFVNVASMAINSENTRNFIGMLELFAKENEVEFVNIISTTPLMVMFVKHRKS